VKCQHKDLGLRALPDKDQDSFPPLGVWDPDKDPDKDPGQAVPPVGAHHQVEEQT